MKREGFNVEVVKSPGADGGRSSSSGRRDECLLTEAEYAEPISDEVQTLKKKGLEWHEDGRNPHPSKWECGKLQQAEANHIARAHHAKDGGKVGHPMTKSVNTLYSLHGRRQLSVQKMTNK